MDNDQFVKVLNGQYVLVERSELQSWLVDVREAQGDSHGYVYCILERVIPKMQNQLNCEVKRIALEDE